MYGDFHKRANKPFNPLLGETFEMVGNGGVKAMSCQVSHHPPVTAMYLEAPYCKLHMNTALKIAFWGKHIEVVMLNAMVIQVKNEELGIDEMYELTLPKNNVNNLIFGKYMEINNWGDLTCRNLTTGDILKTKMNSCTGFLMKAKDKCKIEGLAYRKGSDKPEFRLNGSWLDKLEIDRLDEKGKWVDNTLVYKQYVVDGPDLDTWDEIYRMTEMSMAMNAINPDLRKKLPPTDCRLRPDIRLMEEGKGEEATEVKHRLEQEQRDRKKEIGYEPDPFYFYKEFYEDEKYYWKFGGPRNYWEDRENQDWEHLPHYFDLD